MAVLEHIDTNDTRHLIERGMPLDEIEGLSKVAISTYQDESPGAEFDPSETTEFKDVLNSLTDSSVDLTAASNAVVVGLPTEPPEAVAAFGLETESLTVGRKIFVNLPEHGISADFTVREIRP